MGFSSQLNVGSTFYFDLPIYIEDPKKTHDKSVDKPTSKRRLLICEDDVDQSNYLKEMTDQITADLKQKGFILLPDVF